MEGSREPSLAVGSEVTMKKKVSPLVLLACSVGNNSKPARKSVKAPIMLGAVFHHSEHVGYRCRAYMQDREVRVRHVSGEPRTAFERVMEAFHRFGDFLSR